MSVFQDWKYNKGNLKAQLVLAMFRLAQLANRHIIIALVLCIYLGFYHVVVEWILGIELPRKLKAGKGLVIYHGQALVLNQGVVLGEHCILRNSTTIGHKKTADGGFSACPVIGNRVDIGANVVIIGDISIGDNAIIGAGAVVVKSIPANCVVAGNPAKIIKQF
ncbi:MAG: serine acetyltransferase [Sphingobacteriaceae bacterium]